MVAYSSAVDPQWNKSIFRDSLLFYFMRAVNRRSHLEEFLEICHLYAKNTEAIYFMIGCLLDKSCEILLETDYRIDHIVGKIWEEFMQLRFMTKILYSGRLDGILENSLKIVENYEEYKEHLKGFFGPIFAKYKEDTIKLIKDTIGNYKEELCAAAWHPRRVERWIEEYGLDLFDTF
jgi:hypothetical protein